VAKNRYTWQGRVVTRDEYLQRLHQRLGVARSQNDAATVRAMEQIIREVEGVEPVAGIPNVHPDVIKNLPEWIDQNKDFFNTLSESARLHMVAAWKAAQQSATLQNLGTPPSPFAAAQTTAAQTTPLQTQAVEIPTATNIPGPVSRGGMPPITTNIPGPIPAGAKGTMPQQERVPYAQEVPVYDVLDDEKEKAKELSALKNAFRDIAATTRGTSAEKATASKMKDPDLMKAIGGDPAALARIEVQAIEEQIERGKRMALEIPKTLYEAGKEFSKALQGGDFGSILQGIGGAGGRTVEGAQNLIKDMVPVTGEKLAGYLEPLKIVADLVSVIGTGVETLRNWNKALFDSNAQFAEFSGSMSVVVAEQEIRAMLLSQERGERRASGAREQAESMHRLNKALAPVEDAFARFSNRLSSLASSWAADRLEYLTEKLGLDDPETEKKAEKAAEVAWLAPQGAANPQNVQNLKNKAAEIAVWLEQYGRRHGMMGPFGPRRVN